MILLDQLAYVFDGLRRAVAVVADDEVDLAAVDTAVVINHREVGRFRLTDGAVAGSRPAIRHRAADFDLGVGNTRSVLAGGPSEAARENEADRR